MTNQVHEDKDYSQLSAYWDDFEDDFLTTVVSEFKRKLNVADIDAVQAFDWTVKDMLDKGVHRREVYRETSSIEFVIWYMRVRENAKFMILEYPKSHPLMNGREPEKRMGHPVTLQNQRSHNIGLDDPARDAIDTIRLLAPQCGITDPVVTKSDVIRFALRYVAEALQHIENEKHW